jgi:hypothetical protein
VASNDTRVVQTEGSNMVVPATPMSSMPAGMQSCDSVQGGGAHSTAEPVSIPAVSDPRTEPGNSGVPGHSFPAPQGNAEAPTPFISSGPPGHDAKP